MNIRRISWLHWQMNRTAPVEMIAAEPATVRHLLDYGRKVLAGSDTAGLDSEILLSSVTGYRREYLYAHPGMTVSSSRQTDYNLLLKKRAAGCPVAYLTGQREFWSLPLLVNSDTLIPRPETERLIETVLELTDRQAELDVLDLGTGSGAIAIAIAEERPHCKITALDISTDALAVARENAARTGHTGIKFLCSDWFSELEGIRYDIIVCNPPYVESGNTGFIEGEIRYEPRLALDGGQHGLDACRRIIPAAREHLREKGCLILEHGYNQAGPVQYLLRFHRYGNIHTRQDYSGIERVTYGMV